MKSLDDYCLILGVTLAVTPERLKQAYRDLVKVWHPDRFAHDPSLQAKAEEKLKEINEAYKALQSIINHQTTVTTHPPPRPKTAESREKKPRSAQSAPHVSERSAKSRADATRLKVPKFVRAAQRRPTLFGLGIFIALIIVSMIVNSIHTEIPEPATASNPTVHFEPPPTFAKPSTKKPLEEKELATLRDDVAHKIKESYDGALKLLAVHEEEKKRVYEEYLRRRDLYHQGLISRTEISLAEQALATATTRVDEDKRWLTEAEIAIAQASLAKERINRTK